MGRIGLINSGGESKGDGDLAAAVKTAVINKRAGGQGLISGRKSFQRPMADGVELLNAIQDVYLDAADHRRLTARPVEAGAITKPVRSFGVKNVDFGGISRCSIAGAPDLVDAGRADQHAGVGLAGGQRRSRRRRRAGSSTSIVDTPARACSR